MGEGEYSVGVGPSTSGQEWLFGGGIHLLTLTGIPNHFKVA